ncbi:MAG: amylo-alpha-1,6-glucosidase [Chloroflexi bacterium]|nr:amylo-alpha-1,6-glucosidase [Chloroflexota bacterium]
MVILQDRTFLVTDHRGEIDPDSEQGLFASDTRFVSYYRLTLDDEPWRPLGSAIVSHHAERLHFENPDIVTENGTIPAGQLSLSVMRSIADGMHEDLDITNYGREASEFHFEISLRSDFADVFEVREHRLVRRDRARKRWLSRTRQLVTSYTNLGFRRELTLRLEKCTSAPRYTEGRIIFDITLAPAASWHACVAYVLTDGARVREPLHGCYGIPVGDDVMDELQREWLGATTALASSNPEVDRIYRQSIEDTGSLRMYDDDLAPQVWLPSAGVPSFVALFGRDSLIASLQNLMTYPLLALGALQKLGAYQAQEFDEWRDAEPGKILHELRVGELAHLNQIPHTPYYGTADATILYLIVLHEAWKWLGDLNLLRVHQGTALRCLEWIDRYGDLDGDGFQEYQTRSSRGYENMGWKDSGDAIVYPNGSLVASPKALCELQGYVFDAKMRMAEAFDALGDHRLAAGLREDAAELQRRFDAAFWSDTIGCYVLGLDPAKQPIETVASNAGHCLWSGIASPEHAEQVVERLLQEDMWSGWGIRTLSAKNPAYNPFSYQRGSVWPHDNGIIAHGFKRYGFHREANRVAQDIFRAASYHESFRLPELYSGAPRQATGFPVQYRGANLPQAWAAGSVSHLLQAMLGLRADAPAGRLCVDPALPDWLPEVTLSQLQVGEGRIGLHFWREGEITRWEVTDQDGSLLVVTEPWAPWGGGQGSRPLGEQSRAIPSASRP